jgi:hypothetical protein
MEDIALPEWKQSLFKLNVTEQIYDVQIRKNDRTPCHTLVALHSEAVDLAL